ncbi:MAG: hypothetical protein ABL964_09860 [Steroidobacteraceae bacterium]
MSTTAVVPYSEMERMAVTVAKSNLFGVKDKDQALALMALCQAEGIHPMTAVRDYHIINNRPSLKAETMLARFMQNGGKVQWVTLTDQKAEATFSHPQGGTVTLDWTLDRAKTAGLLGNQTWQKYPRAMLRSRLISEGVRTVAPGIVQGVYTPDELENSAPELVTVSAEQAVQSFDTPPIDQDLSNDAVTQIIEAPTMEALKSTFAAAYTMAKDAKDDKRMSLFKSAYDSRRDELMGIVEAGK